MVGRTGSNGFETVPGQENELDATDQALGTTVMLPDEKDLLSNQVIADYFTADGPRARRIGFSDYEPERSILDESSGEEELRQSGETIAASATVERKKHLAEHFDLEDANSRVEAPEGRSKGVLDEMLTWEIALSLLVVILALAHCMWMWNLVGLSALSLDFGD
ncbi:unnamed protein product [Phytophthora fragariaefolia]|uniref:Unnamed protein product n=1 Tax=Phytophthora fragariaefolia TaxID=1490495 RepID=A0A9W7CWD0_9STRA|nr:unnamed protein product [Phytophthora fragariaefolia]